MGNIKKRRLKRRDTGTNLRDIILGGQDGLVNVLGVILAVAIATHDVKIVIIAGLAATIAESISMAAVAYTSMKAARDFYTSEVRKELKKIVSNPKLERKEIYGIYRKRGFSGHILSRIVSHIAKNKMLWVKTIVEEDLHISQEEYKNPLRDAVVVGISATIGSLIPLLPFLMFDIETGISISLVLSAVVLFIAGAVKGRITTGQPVRSGLELTIIGMVAALAGYAIGAVLGAALYV